MKMCTYVISSSHGHRSTYVPTVLHFYFSAWMGKVPSTIREGHFERKPA